MIPPDAEITLLLRRSSEGSIAARDQLFQRLQVDLRARARAAIGGQRRDLSLGATDLLGEACVRLLGNSSKEYQNRSHFLAVASSVMRCILIDRARLEWRRPRKHALGNSGFDALQVSCDGQVTEVIELDDVLTKLEAFDPAMAQAAEMHAFGGATHEEIAESLELPIRTFQRRWAAAKAWIMATLD